MIDAISQKLTRSTCATYHGIIHDVGSVTAGNLHDLLLDERRAS